MKKIIPIFLSGLLFAGPLTASPWLDPGDSGIRNDIQILADAGVITAPMMAWPIAWADVATGLATFKDADQLSGSAADAYRRLRSRIEIEQNVGGFQASSTEIKSWSDGFPELSKNVSR